MVCICLGNLSDRCEAQNATYRKSPVELRTGFGAALFFGDLGGNFGTRKDAFLDLNPQTIRYNINTGAKYNVTKWFALRAELNFAKLVADDALSTDGFRKTRNLSFRTNISEASLMGELVAVNFLNWRRIKKMHFELYGFGGIGFFRFNPQAQLNGVWYNLRPLGTEGQGLISGTNLYRSFSGVIPFGMGLRKLLNDKFTLGLEVSFRKSFTDYIDDVSGRYYNLDHLAEERGALAAALADRSETGAGRAGGFRGNPKKNDNYGFIQAYVNIGLTNQLIRNEQQAFRRISKKMYTCPRFR